MGENLKERLSERVYLHTKLVLKSYALASVSMCVEFLRDSALTFLFMLRMLEDRGARIKMLN